MAFSICISLCILIVGFSAIDKDLNSTPLDQALVEALVKASKTQSIDFFKLPNETDFDNIPQDPRNPISKEKVELGKLLFHDPTMGINPRHSYSSGTYSCASCHSAKAGFQANLVQGLGEGGVGYGLKGEGRHKDNTYEIRDIDVQAVRTPTILNVAYQKILGWNGQFGATGLNSVTERHWKKDTPKEKNKLGYHGTETQAIAALEVHRSSISNEIMAQQSYRDLFDEVFHYVPTYTRYTDEYVGLAIAAYERTVLPNQAPFQKWLNGDYNAMNDSEKRGALNFFTKAKCNTCHTGPALSSMAFHALGMKDIDQHVIAFIPDGKAARESNLGRGGFTKENSERYQFKVPQLYNLRDSPFYGHGSSFTSIDAIIKYKNNAVKENEEVSEKRLSSHFIPLGLSSEEIKDISNFIKYALYDPNLMRYQPTELPTMQCFPTNDRISKMEFDCNY